jgi:hypothetical protein
VLKLFFFSNPLNNPEQSHLLDYKTNSYYSFDVFHFYHLFYSLLNYLSIKIMVQT